MAKGLCHVSTCIDPKLRCRDMATDTNEIITRGAYKSVKEGYTQEGNQWDMCHRHHMEFHAGAVTFCKKYGFEDQYAKALELKYAFDIARYHSVRRVE